MTVTDQDYWRAYPDTYGERVSHGQWIAYAWLQYTSEIITPLIERGGARIILNAPPRIGKSQLISKWLPLWALERNPAWRVMLATYAESLSRDFGRQCRDVAMNEPLCGVQLRPDKDAAGQWLTPEGGGMVSVGAGGPLGGRGFDLGVIDDCYKNWEDSHSLTNRQKVRDWFNSTFYTRAEPGASIVVAMTRWDADDLCGWLIEEHQDDWTVISLPALAEEGDPMGRAPGESLCPERYSREDYERMSRAVGEEVWAALYTERPLTSSAGRVFRHFDQARNIDSSLEIRPDLPVDMAWDFNLNPGMHCVVGQHDPMTDTFTAVHELHGSRWDVEDTMNVFVERFESMGIIKTQPIHVYGDPSGNTGSMVTSESCYQRIFRELQAHGFDYRRRVPKAAPNVKASLDAFNDALKITKDRTHYLVHPRCERLVEDFKKLKLDENGQIDKSEASLSHASDAERYRVQMIRPIKVESKTKPGKIGFVKIRR